MDQQVLLARVKRQIVGLERQLQALGKHRQRDPAEQQQFHQLRGQIARRKAMLAGYQAR